MTDPSLKHTPGPWWSWGTTVVAEQEGRPQIAETEGHTDQAEANASLIAAAPELAQVVEIFLAHCPTGTNPFLDAAFNKGLAAISKAKGQPW